MIQFVIKHFGYNISNVTKGVFCIRYVSKIAKVDHKKKKILIHFEGWNSRYDEWVSFDSKKIRALPKEKVKSKSKVKEFKVLRFIILDYHAVMLDYHKMILTGSPGRTV